jgi:hypothetical protein
VMRRGGDWGVSIVSETMVFETRLNVRDHLANTQ